MNTNCIVYDPKTPPPEPATAGAPPQGPPTMTLAEAFDTVQPRSNNKTRVEVLGLPFPLVALVQRLPDAQERSGRVFAVTADVALLRYAQNFAIRFKYFRLAKSVGAVVRFDCEDDFEHFWALQKDFMQHTESEGNVPPNIQENDPLIHPPIIAIDSPQTRVKDDAVACWADGNEIVLRSYAAWVIPQATDVATAFTSITPANCSNPLTLLTVLPAPLQGPLRSAFDVQITSHDGVKKTKVFENERDLALNGDAPDRRALVFETRFNSKTLDELIQHRKFFVTKDRISFHLSTCIVEDFVHYKAGLLPNSPSLPLEVMATLSLLLALGERHTPVVQTRGNRSDPRYCCESSLSLSKEDGVTHKISVFGKFGEDFGKKPQGLLSGKKFFRDFFHEVLSDASGQCPLEVSFPEENASFLRYKPFVENLSDDGKAFLRDEINPRIAKGQTEFHYDVVAALVYSLRRGEHSYADDLLSMMDPQRQDAHGGFSVVVPYQDAALELQNYRDVEARRESALKVATAKGPITDFQRAIVYFANPTPTFTLPSSVAIELQQQFNAKTLQLNSFTVGSPDCIRCQSDCDALNWLLQSATKTVKSPKSKWDGSRACRHYLSALSQLLLAVLLQRNNGLLAESTRHQGAGFSKEEMTAIHAHLAECLLREAERKQVKEEEESQTLRALLSPTKVPPGYQLLSMAYVNDFDTNTNAMKVWVGKLKCMVDVSVPRWNTLVGFGSQVQLVAEFKDPVPTSHLWGCFTCHAIGGQVRMVSAP